MAEQAKFSAELAVAQRSRIIKDKKQGSDSRSNIGATCSAGST
jgi:hypothetical protein